MDQSVKLFLFKDLPLITESDLRSDEGLIRSAFGVLTPFLGVETATLVICIGGGTRGMRDLPGGCRRITWLFVGIWCMT